MPSCRRKLVGEYKQAISAVGYALFLDAIFCTRRSVTLGYEQYKDLKKMKR